MRKVRDSKKKSGIIKSTAHFNYGKDPQKKNSDLGKRKVLPRLCNRDLDEIKEYIGDFRYNFCVLNKGKTDCCFGDYENEYKFEMEYALNLSEQISKEVGMPQKKIYEEAMMRLLVTDKNKDCVLKVNECEFYIRTITQDSLSSEMEPRQVNYYTFS